MKITRDYIENIPHSQKLPPVKGKDFLEGLIDTYGANTNQAFNNLLNSSDKSIAKYTNYLAEQIAGGKTLRPEDQKYLADYVKRVSGVRNGW